MSVFRNLLTGLLSALASILIVVGALSVSIMEGIPLTLSTTVEANTPLPTAAPSRPAATAGGVTPLPGLTLQPTAESTVTLYAPTACPVPDGWTEYTIQPGDNLADLARQHGLSTRRLMAANCMVTQSLLTGTVLYLPPLQEKTTEAALPTPTVSCGVPYGWIRYIVRPGDTLFNLSLIYGVSVLDLQYANCLKTSFIFVGEEIWVPNVATRTPRPSPTAPLTATPSRTVVLPTPPPTATVPTPLNPNPTQSPYTVTPPASSTPAPTLTPTGAEATRPASTASGASTSTLAAESIPATPQTLNP